MAPLYSFPFVATSTGLPSLWSDLLYESISPGMALAVCAKCGNMMVSGLSVEVGSHESRIPLQLQRGRLDDPQGSYVHVGDHLCPPCYWYETTFYGHLEAWEDSNDWNAPNYFEKKRPDYIDNLSHALWYGPHLRNLRQEYARYVARLVELKRDAAHKERQESSPVMIPRQVPWSWLEGTDYGRFAVDSDSVAS